MNTTTNIKHQTILLIEDNSGDARLIFEMLNKCAFGRFELIHVNSLADGLAEIDKNGIDAVLLDLNLPDSMGIDTLKTVFLRKPQVPVIVLTGAFDEYLGTQAVSAGAQDYLVKGQADGNAIARSIKYAVERKAARQALEASEKKFRAIFETAFDAIVSANREGGIIYWNPAAEKMFGYSVDEAVGQSITILMPERFQEAHIKGLARYLDCGETKVIGKTVEMAGLRKDGQEFPLELSLTVCKIDSETFFTAVIHDITERKQLEQVRERLLKTLATRNEELESIIYVSCHDLRSPLVNLQGFCSELNQSCQQVLQTISEASDDSLKQKLSEPLSKDIPEDINFIISSVNSLNKLQGGLLTLCRKGVEEINIGSVDMNSVLSEIINCTRHVIRKAEIDVQIGDLPPCLADANQATQIFTNLLDNAIKYLNQDRKGIITISGSIEGDMSVYRVEDNGIGIDAAYQKKVFEIFHRLDPQGPVHGEGIGLTIIKRSLDRMDGRVWLESELGKGSSFFVALPTV